MVAVSIIWILALPHESLWKRTYVDENAISPGQVSMYFDWSNVHQADRYLDHLEKIVNGTFEEQVRYSENRS
jgi:glycosylphosphatidylinositol transamidase